jgi:hypothetical protein
MEAKLKEEGTFASTSTAALATAMPTDTLGIISNPQQIDASVPPTKQSPAPVSLTTEASSDASAQQRDDY